MRYPALSRRVRARALFVVAAASAVGLGFLACGVDLEGSRSEAGNDAATDGAAKEGSVSDGPSDAADAAVDGSSAADASDPCGDASPCVLALAADHTHTCAALKGERPRCWGANDKGQLGSGLDGGAEDLRPSDAPRPVALSGPMTTIDVGGFVNDDHPFSCAVAANGDVICWGSDDLGQRGRGDAGADAAPPALPAPAAVSGVSDVVTGGSHACARRSNGALTCWGFGEQGQLGRALVAGRRFDAMPVTIPTRAPVRRIALGDFHSCLLFTDETVDCFGLNNVGQLGRMEALGGSTADAGTVSGLLDVKDLAAGYTHACAVIGSGSVSCWGWDAFGQLGRGTVTGTSPAPAAVGLSTSRRAKNVCAGYGHSCALMSDGRVMCWGLNDRGQLGVPNVTNQTAVPVEVGGVTDAVAIACGGRHTCAILSDRGAVCWGSNEKGQLGRDEAPDGQPHAAARVVF